MGEDDRLDKLKAELTPAQLRRELAKEARIDIRISAADKRSMTATAKKLGLTLTEYLVRLHQIAVEKLDEHGGGKK